YEELYPGCDYVTRLDFMAKFTYFRVKGYKLSPSYYAIKKTYKMIGLGYESLNACEHDCCLFRGDDNKDLDFCPVCNTSRWKDSNTPGKKISKKVLRYFLIIPRLQCLYKSSHTAKEMIWHATGKYTKPDKMQHLVDGRAWKNFDTKYSDFAIEPRNVRLGLVVDGFNLFGNLSQAYNMWPVILTTYNLPPLLCMKDSSFMLTLLIPGPKSLGKDIDVYLRPLIEDLKVLWDRKGVETINVASGQKFNMRAMVLWAINDFPARCSFSGWSGQGYKACPICNEDTPSVRVLSKTAYVGHRRFLKNPHKWRSSREFNGQTDNRDPPKEFGRDKILAQLDRLPTRLTGKHLSYGGVKIKRNVLVELNWTKWSIFYKLEHWSFLTLRHNLDIMHIKKNMLEAILNTLLMNDKSKDTAMARQDLHRIQNYLPDKITKPIIELCSLFKQICSTNLMEDDMLKAQIKVVDILCDLELIYPLALFDIMIHLVIHLPLEALEGGPIRPRWMFPFERYMKKLKGYVQNKAKPESSIVEGYVAEEALTFIIRLDAQELKKVKSSVEESDWFTVSLLPNSPEIDTYRSQFKSLFPNKDMKEEFPDWFRLQTMTKTQSRDERRTTQNSGICSPGTDGEMYYGQLQEILEFKYLLFKVVLFRVKWFDTRNQGCKVKCLVLRNNMTQINTRGVIVVEDDHDIIHFDNSSNLPLFTCLNDLDNATLHIDGQSTEVDVPPDIIDVVDEYDDIINDEDPIPRDLVDSDDEDLINVDDDGVHKMSANVALSHGDDGGGEDRPPLHYVPIGCGGCFANRGKGKRKPNLGGPFPIRFEVCDKQTLMPLSDHEMHWSSYIGEVIRGVPLYYHTWLKVPKEWKAALIADIRTQFDLRPHIESLNWTVIEAGIQQHLQKAYNTNKAAFKAQHWVIDTETGSYNVKKIRRARPESITTSEWDKKSSATQEYPSLIDTFFIAHTVDGVFTRDEDCLIYSLSRVVPSRGGCEDDEESADDQEYEDGNGDGDGDGDS
nr:hypothetical protein [Tanacetum cinerariifolium]